MGSFLCRHWKQGTPQKNGREIMPLTVATMVCLPNVCHVVPAKIRQIYQRTPYFVLYFEGIVQIEVFVLCSSQFLFSYNYIQ